MLVVAHLAAHAPRLPAAHQSVSSTKVLRTRVSLSTFLRRECKQRSATHPSRPAPSAAPPVIRHVDVPTPGPPPPAGPAPGQNICADCGRLIVGVFCRINERALHAECFKCSTCGTSLKNVGYFNINDKLYCDVHAQQAAQMISPRADVPGPNLIQQAPAPAPAPQPQAQAP